MNNWKDLSSLPNSSFSQVLPINLKLLFWTIPLWFVQSWKKNIKILYSNRLNVTISDYKTLFLEMNIQYDDIHMKDHFSTIISWLKINKVSTFAYVEAKLLRWYETRRLNFSVALSAVYASGCNFNASPIAGRSLSSFQRDLFEHFTCEMFA